MNRIIKGAVLLGFGIVMLIIGMIAQWLWGWDAPNPYVLIPWIVFFINTVWGYRCLYEADDYWSDKK